MNKTLDIIITTYNRPFQVSKLVEKLLSLNNLKKNVIVVDSSQSISSTLKNNENIIYLRSSYKAQPYQRYVGLLASKAEYVIFLDDDLEVIDSDVFHLIVDVFLKNEEIVGVTAKVDYKSGLFVQKDIKSFSRFLGPIKNVFQKISINDLPDPGKISLGGNGGGYLFKNDFVEYFPGPNMAFKREVALKLFDQTLFAAYVKKIGKGEDKYLSMKANLYGKLYCLGKKVYFYHPPIESTYNSILVDFQAKQSFSRFLLIVQYLKVFYNHEGAAIFIYLWYSLFRIFGSLNNFQRLKGILKGIFYVFKYGTNPDKIMPRIDFFKMAKLDAKV